MSKKEVSKEEIQEQIEKLSEEFHEKLMNIKGIEQFSYNVLIKNDEGNIQNVCGVAYPEDEEEYDNPQKALDDKISQNIFNVGD